MRHLCRLKNSHLQLRINERPRDHIKNDKKDSKKEGDYGLILAVTSQNSDTQVKRDVISHWIATSLQIASNCIERAKKKWNWMSTTNEIALLLSNWLSGVF